MPSSSPPRNLHAVVPVHGRAPLRVAIFPDPSWWCHPQACDAVLEPAKMLSSPRPWRCAPHAIPKPTMLPSRAIPGPAALSSSPSPGRHCEHDVLEPGTSSIPRPPRATNATCIFSLLFWAYKSWFWYAILLLFCCIALICYIVILFRYATHCYIAFVLLHSDLYECILHYSMMKVG
jgi:hypothetical protein